MLFGIIYFQLLLSTLIKIFALLQRENWTEELEQFKQNLRNICQIEESNSNSRGGSIIFLHSLPHTCAKSSYTGVRMEF